MSSMPESTSDVEPAIEAEATEAAPKQAPELSAEQLALAIDIATTALDEVTEFNFVGDFHEAVAETADVYSLRFVSHSPGFRDWWWTVTMTQVADAATPTVLECGLLPGEDALLAPEWVPWAKRLARFRATHDSHGNLLPEADAAGDEDEEATPVPRTRTRKRTRTRLRRRGDSAKTGAEELAEETASDGEATDAAETEAPAGTDADRGETLPVAADIRDFAEEMDEVLDGVTFEADEDDSESASAEGESAESGNRE